MVAKQIFNDIPEMNLLKHKSLQFNRVDLLNFGQFGSDIMAAYDLIFFDKGLQLANESTLINQKLIQIVTFRLEVVVLDELCKCSIADEQQDLKNVLVDP